MKLVIFVVLSILIAVISAHPTQEIPSNDEFELPSEHKQLPTSEELEMLSVHSRQKREPKDRGTAEVNVNRNRGGTDVGAQVNARIWQSRDRKAELNGNANVNKHFGGPSGKTRPNYGVGLNFQRRF